MAGSRDKGKEAMATTLRRTTLGPFRANLQDLLHSDHSGLEAAWTELAGRCENLRGRLPFPIESNALTNICKQPGEKLEAIQDVTDTCIVCLPRVAELCEGFLQDKRMHGSQQEKEVYKGMDLDTFLRRLVSKRPLVFMNAQDLFVLRDGSKGSYGANLFDAIGTDHEDPRIRLRDYISYDEMALSALLAISSPTTFINNGSRDNCGIPSNAGSFQRRGVYLAQTGARFERPGRMEAKHMLLRKSDTTTANGYGADNADFSPFARWAKLYGMPHLPTFEEAAAVIAAAATRTCAEAGDTRDFVQLGDSAILDCRAYIARMEIVAETFLLEANDRAANEGKRASCFVVGLGLGVWSVHSCQQTLVIKAYARVLQRMPLPNIAELRFSYFRTNEWPLQEHEAHTESRHIAVRFERENPADRLEDPSLLLVAQYAADSNSFPGNEYWLGGAHLSGSGDPAAAACSTIAEIANPELHV